MIYQVLAVLDRAADAYGRPIFVLSIGQGIRSFQTEINRAAEDNTMHQHPDDFDLWHLGTYNDNTGIFENLHEPKQLAIGKQIKTNGSRHASQ